MFYTVGFLIVFLVGSQLFKTRTINNDLDPVFNECFEAVVDQASGQRLRIELFDEDTTSTDEELGRLSIPLDMVQNSGVIDRVYNIFVVLTSKKECAGALLFPYNQNFFL